MTEDATSEGNYYYKYIIQHSPIELIDSRVASKLCTVNKALVVAGRQLSLELQPHMSSLLNSLPHKVQDNLMDKGLLSYDDVNGIQARPTLYDQNREMYRRLFSRVRKSQEREFVKAAVCRGLCESSQCCPFSQQKREAASSSQVQALNDLRPRLKEDMEVGQVLDELYQAKILDKHSIELINEGKTRRDRVLTFLSIMSRMHSKAQDTFMTILRKTNWWIFEQ